MKRTVALQSCWCWGLLLCKNVDDKDCCSAKSLLSMARTVALHDEDCCSAKSRLSMMRTVAQALHHFSMLQWQGWSLLLCKVVDDEDCCFCWQEMFTVCQIEHRKEVTWTVLQEQQTFQTTTSCCVKNNGKMGYLCCRDVQEGLGWVKDVNEVGCCAHGALRALITW